MPDAGQVLTAFREELIAAGLVRRPSDVGVLPPAHIEPLEGAVAPGDRAAPEDHPSLVLSLLHSGDLAEATGYEATQRRRTVIDVRFRMTTNAGERQAMTLDAGIRARIFRPQTNYGYGFLIGTAAQFWAHQVALWGGYGTISRAAGTGIDAVAKYLVECQP